MKNRAIDCRNGANCIRTPGKHDVRCKGAGCKIRWKPDGQNIECSGGAAHCAHGGTAGLGYHIYICTIVHLLLSHSSFLYKKILLPLEHFAWVLLTVLSVHCPTLLHICICTIFLLFPDNVFKCHDANCKDTKHTPAPKWRGFGIWGWKGEISKIEELF